MFGYKDSPYIPCLGVNWDSQIIHMATDREYMESLLTEVLQEHNILDNYENQKLYFEQFLAEYLKCDIDYIPWSYSNFFGLRLTFSTKG
jgi:hypothetical protein